MTKGFKSTEFWVILASTGVAAYLAHTGVPVQTIAAVVAGPSTYALGRGLAKQGNGG